MLIVGGWEHGSILNIKTSRAQFTWGNNIELYISKLLIADVMQLFVSQQKLKTHTYYTIPLEENGN
jgi:hypothetical protein